MSGLFFSTFLLKCEYCSNHYWSIHKASDWQIQTFTSTVKNIISRQSHVFTPMIVDSFLDPGILLKNKACNITPIQFDTVNT